MAIYISKSGRSHWLIALITACLALSNWGRAQSPQPVQIKELQGTVEWQSAGATNWSQAKTGQTLQHLDHLRTKENSRVSLLWYDQSVITFGALTEIEILPAKSNGQQGLQLFRGILSFFHRDEPGRIQIITRGATAGVEGTEFVMTADEADRTTLSVVDGQVRLGNLKGSLLLTNSEQAVVEPGRAPERTAGFIANNLLQWCLYYPAVLDLHDLPLPAESSQKLTASLAAYRSGDLLAALKAHPANQTPANDSERIYYAALLLSVGQVEQSETVMAGLGDTNAATRPQQLATALRTLIAAVKRQPIKPASSRLATEFLADSYYQQSLARRDQSLQAALNDAHAAVSNSPNFSFARERVAELEFMFGRTKAAFKALDQSLALAPRNAQALALKGFLLSAQNSPRAAITWFDKALEVDSALGNAWLGRGLARIRIGDTAGGRQDLLMAAALEPQRAELRSYLGKAYVAAGEDALATKELNLAKKLDPNDPTPWLYSALQKQNNNQINDAIRDLEKSQTLNDNRSVYRSQLLLDQDQAVRAANLASVYRDAGMYDLSVREAGQAVSYDYANYSAHLFLGNSYNQLRDANWSNLRYETPAVSEFWMANLLAPTSVGWMSPLISEQPYAKLFEQNRVGLISETTYLSRGAWQEDAEQSYTSGDFSYSLGTSYLHDPGQRPNSDYELRTYDLNLKGQVTSQDSVFVTLQKVKLSNGDVSEYYDQSKASSDLQFNETQQPNVFLGYHHEWAPGSHTLLFASRQVAYESARTDKALQSFGVINGGEITGVRFFVNTLKAQLQPENYSTEIQQILETPDHTTVVGTRYQWGDVHYQNAEATAGDLGSGYAGILFPDPFAYPIQDFTLNYHQLSLYGYHTWQIWDPFAVTVGLTYDWLDQPSNLGTAPFTDQEQTTVLFSPKFGFIWKPADKTTLRAAYTRSLSGFANGQSMRLEPTEVAGFNQAFRSLIPESVAGDTSGSQFDTVDASLEQKFGTGTYLALAGQILSSKLDDVTGAYIYNGDQTDTNLYPTYTSGFRQSQDFHEYSAMFSADQLLGKQWSVGTRYRWTKANLNINDVDISSAYLLGADPGFYPHQSLNSTLNTVNLHANWNHPIGLFSIFEANWNHQENSGFTPAEPGDDFWQFNAYAGYRMWHRRVEIMVGLLNIFDQDYQMEPLNLYNETARSRTFLARLRINF